VLFILSYIIYVYIYIYIHIYESIIFRVFPKKDITNFLLVGALTGTGMYLYTREHMKSASQSIKILYR
jgi:hypothetical protein